MSNNPITSGSSDLPKSASSDRVGSKNTRNKDDARSKFNPKAPLKTIEECFSGFTQTKRSNVTVELDTEVIPRIDETYVPHVETYTAKYNYNETKQQDYIIEAKLMTRCAMMKKLLLATPASEENQVRRYQQIVSGELFIPPALSAYLDCIGKTDDDEFIIRMKDNVYTIHSLALDIAKTFVHHSSNRYRYTTEERNNFNDYTIGNVIFQDEASLRYLKSMAAQKLENLYVDDFLVTVPATNEAEGYSFRATYPKLPISDDVDKQVVNFAQWINKLAPQMEGITDALACGLLTVAQKHWFTDNNVDRQLRELLPDLGLQNYDVTPRVILTYIVFRRLNYNDYSDNNIYFSLVTDAFSLMLERTLVNLGPVFNLALMPISKFGNQAQLVYHPKSEKYQRRSTYAPDLRYQELNNTATARSMKKLKETGLASLALTFGVSKSVKYEEIFRSTLNTGVLASRAKFLKRDLKQI